MDCSIIIPAYNEADQIAKTVDALKRLDPDEPPQIVIVDDGSERPVADILADCNAPELQIVRHRVNRGYGAALKTGIRKARHRVIVIADADGSYPISRIPDLLAEYARNHHDMLVGSRGGDQNATPWIRRPPKWLLGKLANYVTEMRIPDINSGMRVFDRDLVRRFFSILPDGFSFTTTITLAMIINGYHVGFAPIDYFPRVGRSKIRPIRDTLNFFQLVLNIALYFAPRKVFLMISGALSLMALAWALFTKFVLGQLADVSTIVIIMTAVQIAGVGLLAELIVRRIPSQYSKEDETP